MRLTLHQGCHVEWRLWVNNGLYRQPCHTSAYPPEADENDAKAEVTVGMSAVGGKADEIGTITDIGQRMSAVGGRADVVCQGLSGPFIAIS